MEIVVTGVNDEDNKDVDDGSDGNKSTASWLQCDMTHERGSLGPCSREYYS